MAARDIDKKLIDRLKSALIGHGKKFTISDAAVKSGLSFPQVKSALNYLVSEYRGQLDVTETGEILYSFPYNFKKPWEKQEKLTALYEKTKKAALGILKFIVRAWISIVMIGYVAIFALVLIAMTASRNQDRGNSSSRSDSLMLHTLIRLVLDSLFWTFHPFSPFALSREPYYSRNYYVNSKPKVPFYEKVNKFFFGPEEKTIDKKDRAKLILQEIRANKGRIGLFDIMRVTGLTKEEADPFMTKLIIDYDGDIKVSQDGGIYYEFPSIRLSTNLQDTRSAPSIWQYKEKAPDFTGNPPSSNILITCLNGFNLFMSLFAISNSLTIERLLFLFTGTEDMLLPPPATPLVLGWVPFIFSLTLFMIPAIRALLYPRKVRLVRAKNGFRGLIKTILNKFSKNGIKEEELRQGWKEQAGLDPRERELTRSIIRLGGDLELDANDQPVFKFKALEKELGALFTAREKAQKSEAEVGQIIFSSAQ